jgi:hypothetical protein
LGTFFSVLRVFVAGFLSGTSHKVRQLLFRILQDTRSAKNLSNDASPVIISAGHVTSASFWCLPCIALADGTARSIDIPIATSAINFKPTFMAASSGAGFIPLLPYS